MMTPVNSSKYLLFGMLTQGDKTGSKKGPLGERDLKVRFQRGDLTASALIHFANNENFKSTAILKLYDVDNQPVASGKPEKVSVNRGESVERIWQLPLANLPAGVFRVDLQLDDLVVWRQYFKLSD